jgi:DNA replicative helicase MCM subunit Mcm2 (Cdc46/Mcm family)
MKWNKFICLSGENILYFECSKCRHLVRINYGSNELQKLKQCPKCGENVDKTEENK